MEDIAEEHRTFYTALLAYWSEDIHFSIAQMDAMKEVLSPFSLLEIDNDTV